MIHTCRAVLVFTFLTGSLLFAGKDAKDEKVDPKKLSLEVKQSSEAVEGGGKKEKILITIKNRNKVDADAISGMIYVIFKLNAPAGAYIMKTMELEKAGGVIVGKDSDKEDANKPKGGKTTGIVIPAGKAWTADFKVDSVLKDCKFADYIVVVDCASTRIGTKSINSQWSKILEKLQDLPPDSRFTSNGSEYEDKEDKIE